MRYIDVPVKGKVVGKYRNGLEVGDLVGDKLSLRGVEVIKFPESLERVSLLWALGFVESLRSYIGYDVCMYDYVKIESVLRVQETIDDAYSHNVWERSLK